MSTILETMANAFLENFYKHYDAQKAMAAALRKAAELVMQDDGLKENEVLDIRDWLLETAEQVP